MDEVVMAKLRRKCSKCGKAGHYAPTCKGKKKIKVAKGKGRKKKAGKKTKKTIRRSTTTKGKGRSLVGRGSGWIVFHYGGRTQKGNVSNKTWAIKISGNTVTTRHGKTWGQKKETPKKYASREAALAAAERIINSKLRKGYHLVGGNRKRHKGRKLKKK